MAFTEYDINEYDFSEVELSLKQVQVTNNLGRTALQGEFVYLDGYFGNVVEYGGIANGATGMIDINSERKIRTKQVEATDTFTAGNVLWFVSGGAGAAGTFEDADPGSGTRYACGIITGEEGTGGAQTAVEFIPFVQRMDGSDLSAQIGVLTDLTTTEQGTIVGAINEVDSNADDNTTNIGTLGSLTTSVQTDLVSAVNEVDANADANTTDIATINAEPKILVQKITADASGGIAVSGLSEGDEVIGMSVIATVTESNGTMKLTDGSNDITDAIACATDTNVDYASTIDDAHSVIGAGDTPALVAGGDTAGNTRGIAIITYIPA